MRFNLSEFMNSESMNLSQRKTDAETVMLPVSKLVPARENFYSKDEERVRRLAATIEMLATSERSGVQDNLVVKRIEGTDRYEILAGETRWSAVKLLLEEGRITNEMVPCRVESSGDAVREELILIFTNSTQRVRSDAEKMHEIERLRELLTEYRKTHSLGGTMQQAIAEILSVSKSKVGTLEHISKSLIKPLMEMYEEGKIPTSVANRIAGFEEEKQKNFANYVGYTKTDYVTGDLVEGFCISYERREQEAAGEKVENVLEDAVVFQADVPEAEEQEMSDAEEEAVRQEISDTVEETAEQEISFPLQFPQMEKTAEEKVSEDPAEKNGLNDAGESWEDKYDEMFDNTDALDVLEREITRYKSYVSDLEWDINMSLKYKNGNMSYLEVRLRNLHKSRVVLAALKQHKETLMSEEG